MGNGNVNVNVNGYKSVIFSIRSMILIYYTTDSRFLLDLSPFILPIYSIPPKNAFLKSSKIPINLSELWMQN